MAPSGSRAGGPFEEPLTSGGGHYAYRSLDVTNCMANRSAIAVALVAVVVLAGCSALVGDGAGGPDSPDEFEYAAGYNADGVTNDSEAIRSHQHALTNRSGFTTVYDQNVTGEETNLTYEVRYEVDVDGEEAYHRVDAPSLEFVREEYYGNDTRYTRVVNAGEEQTSSNDAALSAGNFTGIDAIERMLSNDTDFETSIEERDGTPVVVYETEGAANAVTMFSLVEENVTSFSASFAVDSDGLVRTARYDLEYTSESGEELTITLDFAVRDLDGTTVDRPGWVDDV